MAIRKIRTDGDPILRKVSRRVDVFDWRLWQLLDDMKETMQKENGVGLAAVQVGVLRRIVVVDTGEKILELMNPEIVEQSGSYCDIEGCLSFPGVYGMVERPTKVTVRAQDRNGEFFEFTGEGVIAKAFCHETEHLDGKLFVDRVDHIMSQQEINDYLDKKPQDKSSAQE
ncbi:MAG: peptide deformylase [Clostridia bacterium]|nr:peptide deformylase [Clostridia bacterium]